MKLSIHIPYDESKNDVLYFIEELKELGLDIKEEYWHSIVPPDMYVFIIEDTNGLEEEIKSKFRDMMKDTLYPGSCNFSVNE